MSDITVTQELLAEIERLAALQSEYEKKRDPLKWEAVLELCRILDLPTTLALIARIRELEAENAKLNKDCRRLQDKNSQMAQEWIAAQRDARRKAIEEAKAAINAAYAGDIWAQKQRVDRAIDSLLSKEGE